MFHFVFKGAHSWHSIAIYVKIRTLIFTRYCRQYSGETLHTYITVAYRFKTLCAKFYHQN